jgi:hypothetical protein
MDKGRLKVTFYNYSSDTKKRFAQNFAALVYHYHVKPLVGKSTIGFKDKDITNCAADNLILQKWNQDKKKPYAVRKKRVVKESQMDSIVLPSEMKIPYADNCTVRPRSYREHFSQVIWR